jgi:DNA-binding transcriptional ArsR family regulator
LTERAVACYTLNQMVESRSDRLDAVFHALAHPVRRQILRELAKDERSVSELAEPFDMSLEAVSKHVDVLERARLLNRSQRGRIRHCKFRPEPLRDAAKVLDALAAMWTSRLDALETLLTEDE